MHMWRVLYVTFFRESHAKPTVLCSVLCAVYCVVYCVYCTFVTFFRESHAKRTVLCVVYCVYCTFVVAERVCTPARQERQSSHWFTPVQTCSRFFCGFAGPTLGSCATDFRAA